MSIKDQIKKATDLTAEVVEVPEWGVEIEVRSMSARQRAAMTNFVSDDMGAGERQEALWTFLLTSCCFDPSTKEPVFDESDMEWLLSDKSFNVIDKLTTRCLQVSAVLSDSMDEAGKDSSDTQTSKA